MSPTIPVVKAARLESMGRISAQHKMPEPATIFACVANYLTHALSAKLRWSITISSRMFRTLAVVVLIRVVVVELVLRKKSKWMVWNDRRSCWTR